MKFCTIRDTDIKVNPFLIVFCIGACIAGLLDTVAMTFLVVTLHEICHTLAAKALGVMVYEIELMPFGGVARMQPPDEKGASEEFLIALAGPAFNIAVVGILSSLVLNQPQLTDMLSPWIKANLTIGIFNLVPAFPLDGGRMLRSIMTYIIGGKRANKVASFFGIALGGMMILSGCAVFYTEGKINITLISIGVFIILAAIREKKEWTFSVLSNATAKKRKLKHKGMQEKRMVAGKNIRAREMMATLSKGEYNTITVLDDDMRVLGTLGENELMQGVVEKGADVLLGELVGRS